MYEISMRVASIGDLHLCDSPTLDGFRGPESSLLGLLDHLERTHDRIVLLGDIVGTDYGTAPGSSAAVLRATMRRYARTVERWRAPPYTLVFGNHDPITEAELGARESVDLEQDGFRVRLLHGPPRGLLAARRLSRHMDAQSSRLHGGGSEIGRQPSR